MSRRQVPKQVLLKYLAMVTMKFFIFNLKKERCRDKTGKLRKEFTR
jgi:hypothetical protein